MLEGDSGFIQSVMDGDFDVGKFTDFGGRFRILDTEFKAWAACGTMQGHINATLNLVREHNIKPEDVANVRIQAGTRSIQHTGDPIKRYPKNKETADHSAYYVTAIAILERELGPDQYSFKKFTDPKVRELSDKVSLEINTELDRFGRAGSTEITTKRGDKYSSRVDYPKGHPKNPITDEELRTKFRSLESRFISQRQSDRIIKTISNMDTINDIGKLMKLLVFDL